MPDHILNSEHQSMLWGFLGILSSIVGLVCYALSSSFEQLFGEWKIYKFLLYILTSLVICVVFLFVKKIKVSNSVRVLAHVRFFVLMLTSLYSFFYDKHVKGNPDALSIISYAAFALMSLCFSRKLELGFEVGFFYFFLGCLALQLMKIHSILAVLGVVFCFSIIFVRSYSDSEDHTGTPGTVENLEIIVDPANGISNQADSNEESPLLPSIGSFPGNSNSGHNQENIETESTEQDNVSYVIQSDVHSNVSSEFTEQHNVFFEIQSNAQSSQLRRRHRPREPNDDVNYRPLVAEHFLAIDLLKALGPGRLIFELCTATIHFLNSWWKKIRRWREKIQVSSSSWVKARVGFLVLMLASLYILFHDEAEKGNPDALSIVSYAALALMSLCFLSGKLKLGFEVGFLNFFLGCVGVLLMKIHLILVVLLLRPRSLLFGFPRSHSNPKKQCKP